MTRPPLSTAADVMTTRVVKLSPTASILDAIQRMLEHGIPVVVIVDEGGAFAGVLTEHDCLKLIAAASYGDQPQEEQLQVGRYLSQTPTVAPDLEIYQVTAHFEDPAVWAVAVIREDEVAGVITRRDLLRGIREMQDEVVARLGQRHHDHLTPSSFFGATHHDASEIAARLKR